MHWDIINLVRSIDNGLFSVYSNRIGTEWEKVYFGESMIVNPFGKVIAKGKDKIDAVVSAELDLDQVDEARIAVPTLRDIRNDLWMKYYQQPRYDSPASIGYQASMDLKSRFLISSAVST